MLIKFFRSSYLLHYFTLFALALILWSGAIIHPVDVVASPDVYPFYSIIYFWFGENKLLFSLMGFILLFFEAILINSIITENDIIPKNSLLPGFIYVVLMSFSPELLTLHPVLITNLFLIIIISFVFKMFGKNEPYRFTYKLGFYVGLATLFYLPVYVFLIYIFVVLFLLRLLNWREFIIPIVGFLTLYIFLTVWYYFFDQLDLAWYDYLNFFQNTSLIVLELDFLTIIILSIFAILFMLSIIYLVGRKYYEKSISIRIKLKLTFFFLLFSIIPIIFYAESVIKSLVILAIPLSVFVSFYLSELKKIYILNFLLIFLLILIIINNFHLLDLINL